jgi:hypothetical protein
MRLGSEESGRSAGILWAASLLLFIAPYLAVAYYFFLSLLRPGAGLPGVAWLIVGIWGLVLGAIVWGLVQGTKEYARFGRSFVQLDNPLDPGKEFAGVLELSGKAAGAQVEISLRYLQAVNPQSLQHTRGIEQCNWDDRRSGIADSAARMRFVFMMPPDLPPHRSGARWELAARVQVQNARFTRHFKVPVHAA